MSLFLSEIMVLSLGVHGEPSLPDPFFLFKQLQDTPQAGASKHPEDRAENHALHAKTDCNEGNACEQKCPPAACPKIVFALNYNRMEYADYKECHNRNKDTCKVHG